MATLPKLTAHQIDALCYIADNSYGGKYSVDVQRGEVGERTAHALEKLGLVTCEGHAGSHTSRIGGFTGRAGYQKKAFVEVRASLTPLGKAVAEAKAATARKNPAPLPKLTPAQMIALRYLSKAPYAPGWRDTGKHCRLPTARKLESLGLVEVRAEVQSDRVFTGGFIRTGRPGGSQTHVDSWVAFDVRLTPLGKAVVAAL